MLFKWLQRLSFYLFLPALAVVCWGELSKTAAATEQLFWDKALHFFAYFGLAGLLSVALRGDRRVAVAALLLAWLGAVLEILQGVTGRDPSVADALTNVLGVLAGAAIGWLVVRLIGSKTLAGHPLR